MELDKADPKTWQVLSDSTYHFRIAYPPHYAMQYLSEAELARLSPRPLAAIHFRDRRSELSDIAPPAFSVSVFQNKGERSLERWLTEAGLIRREVGWLTEPYTGRYIAGIKALSPNYMAPGEFIYIAAGAYVFQLVPLGDEAKLMLDTFAITKTP